ncbi:MULTISPECIES: zinc chelation protein SecC [unclassified Mesorhizobium]|uniref:zinc chelation protein SecC n=1 Tax=unclassified Mesorhizobium TaxID=325217 RepID=UPI00112B75D0|nr:MULTISPECIES: zinc chelation protein SecC [unclassified Mesorhizobium]TPK57426.1 zinc chelation protein SecC [Mesorhizobium sp. B2-5-1]TPM54076.1 zinc chelation protein SecC [Mesorhizobium sp. B2-1-9]TPM80445.1 zinc chelation protein SecC [Mesorhizobium sp. B2-1-4]TPN04854.1 zinc chelation protein SecC [Mesorhizobium sp. B2-1-2]UCI13154.1 hypothetical protein FJ972_26875 [Mesorhizobium sp. B2-1-1]
MEREAPDIPPLFEQMLNSQPMFGFGGMNLANVAKEHEIALGKLSQFQPVQLAAIFGGLLTQPILQANCVRLEALVHLSLAIGNGSKKPSSKVVGPIFAELGRGMTGRLEDPAEDIFVSLIVTPRGDFRLLEGVWESAGFYTQRLLNTLERLPDNGVFRLLRNRVYALLALSEAVCQRAGLKRYAIGDENPHLLLPRTLRDRLGAVSQIVRFSREDLSALGISPDDLAEFGFDPRRRLDLQSDQIGNSLLERYPVVFSEADTYLILPSAVSASLRRYVIETMELFELREAFAATLAHEFADAFAELPLLGGGSGAELEFRKTENGMLAGVTMRADAGRFINLIFFSDTLDEFAEGGLVGIFPQKEKRDGLASDVDQWIDFAWQQASASEGFKGGVTFLVPCGLGRGVVDFFSEKARENWPVEFVGASDLFTLSWIPDFKPLSLWRLLDGRNRLAEMGVELQNINGLLNLVAWVRQLGGHLVPHASLPIEFGLGDGRNFVMIEQNGLLKTRKEVAEIWDVHSCRDIEGHWIPIRKERASMFAEDNEKSFYVAVTDTTSRWPLGVFETAQRAWWIRLVTDEGVAGSMAFQHFQTLRTWICLIAPVLEVAFETIPSGPVLLRAAFKGSLGDRRAGIPDEFMTLEATLGLISSSAHGSTVDLEIADGFDHAVFNPENVAETAFVQRIVEGFASLSGISLDQARCGALLSEIIPGPDARQSHPFPARNFRDFVQRSAGRPPLTIDNDDGALIKLGLGWRVRARSEGGDITGREACTSFLNRLVKVLEDDLCAKLRSFDRKSLIRFALLNHERAALDRERWHRTAAAVLALHKDRDATLEGILHHEAELNAVFQASRLLVEFAICECPLDGGAIAGRLDVSRMMATIMMIGGMGGWSDAIRWDAMEPRIQVTALGDVQANVSFQENVLQPFGRATTRSRIDKRVRDYARNLKEPEFQETDDLELASNFLVALEEQFGASLDTIRKFVDFVENLGIRRTQAVLELRRSDVLNAELDGVDLNRTQVENLVAFLTFKSRSSWREIPDGYHAKDLFPWRFRRRLSILRKPLIQVDDEADPTFLVAPGILRDSFVYMFGNYHRGDFPIWQLSPAMKRWAGASRDRQGSEFAQEVSARLKELGWQTETEVPVTKLLAKGFERDFGDVDVLAWRDDSPRTLLIECKDVQFRKTEGEIAEQLSDFRGVTRSDGKPDLLRKHLDRVDLISKEHKALERYVNQSGSSKIEGHLVFKHMVPMEYAWEHMRERIALHVFDDLDKL